MSGNNGKNTNETDQTGDVMSWVIIFILMFAFPPIGLLLLILRMRSNAAKLGNTTKSSHADSVEAERASREAKHAGHWQAAGQAASQAAEQAKYAANQAAEHAKNATGQAATQASASAQQAINQATAFAQTAIKEASAAAQSAIKEATGIAWEVSGQAPPQEEQESQTRKTDKQAQSTTSRQPERGYGTARPAAHSGGTIRSSYDKYSTSSPNTFGKKASAASNADSPDGNVLEKKSGKAISIILLLISIALFVVGANSMIGAATSVPANSLVTMMPEFWMGAFYFIGGFISLFSRNLVSKKLGRYKTYYAYIAGRNVVPMSSIAQTVGIKVKTVRKDIQKMINEGYFDAGTYIDKDLDSLILCGDTAEEMRKTTYGAEEEVDTEVHHNQYMATLKELRDLKATVADMEISGKIDKIEELTGKIFKIVEENPDKKSQIRRFESYYLPTTMKLIRSYSTLEKQGVKGENIMASKENIGRILDTLVTGYEQQLDQLFSSDAMDIEADINVLENLMAQDGLSDDKSEFKTMTG
jgi:hypothetical protein